MPRDDAKKQVQERVLQELGSNSVWNQVVERCWICPYCGDVGSERSGTDCFVDDVFEHLLGACASWNGFRGAYLPMKALDVRAVDICTTRNLSTNPLWKLFDEEGRWYCPYCGLPVEMDASSRSDPGILRKAIFKHVSSCAPAESGRGQTLRADHLERQVKMANAIGRLVPQIRTRMEADVTWSAMRAEGSWICPFCHDGVDSVDVSSELLRREIAPIRAAQHLIRACPAYSRDGKTVGEKGSVTRIILRDPPPRVFPDDPQEDAGSVASDIDVDAFEESSSHAELTAALAENTEMDESRPELETITRRIERAQTGVVSRARIRLLSQCPEPPDVRGIDAARLYRPSRKIGGDGVFFHIPGERQLCFALYTLSPTGSEVVSLNEKFQERLLSSVEEGQRPKEVMTRLNESVDEFLDPGQYVTMLYGYLNRTAEKLWLGNAGHHAPFLYSQGSVEALRSSGFVLSPENRPTFGPYLRELKIPFEKGHCLVAYGDRSLEMTNDHEREFGVDSLKKSIGEHADQDATYLLENIEALLEEHVGDGDVDEDITFLALKSY